MLDRKSICDLTKDLAGIPAGMMWGQISHRIATPVIFTALIFGDQIDRKFAEYMENLLDRMDG